MGLAASLLTLALLETLTGIASANEACPQNGDKAGEEQLENWHQWQLPSNAPLSPAEELASFQVAPGFRVELVAAEPLVREPVAMQWDEHGRLWVVEMSSFMQDVEGSDELDADGFVVVLEDTNGDGTLDKRNVFADQLVLPRALCVVKGGALILSPPHLLFCEDTDGDLIADRRTIVASGFESGLSNPEHAPNGLMWGLDNWIYNAKDGTRYRFLNGKLEQSPTSFNGQWGISQDDAGRIYYNTNSYPLYGNVLSGSQLLRNSNLKRKKGIAVGLRATAEVWPSRPTPGVNRGYRKGTLRSDGTLQSWTGACGPHIYRGSLLPGSMRGSAFVCEPCGNFVRFTEIHEDDGLLTAVNPAPGSEFLTSTDERFRPVNLCGGPDGALYIADFYRGILQHRVFLTSYLRQQIEERDLGGPQGRGRIWRIVPDEQQPLVESSGAPNNERHEVTARPKALGNCTQLELVAALERNDGWSRQTAQRLLVESALEAATESALQMLAQESAKPLARLHALHILHTQGLSFGPTLISALESSDPQLIAHAIRLSAKQAEYVGTIWAVWQKLAQHESKIVRRQLALSLGELERAGAMDLLGALLRANADDPLLPSAALSGVKNRELQLLLACAHAKVDWPHVNSMEQTFTLLAETIARGGHEDTIVAAVNFAVQQPTKVYSAIILGIGQGSSGKPPQAAAIASLPNAHRDSIQRGAVVYKNICSACHAPNGAGAPGLAPPLAGSEWLEKPPTELINIVLQGLDGPIQVAGEDFDLSMPPLATLSDTQIADVLNWVRWQWSRTTALIAAREVKAAR
jgi:mono/diheme cytochrome c family protein/glucose/arabinose dehydrogenase